MGDSTNICFDCKKCTGACNWSRDFLPIKGWIATPSIIKNVQGYIKSYHITFCPEFEVG